MKKWIMMGLIMALVLALVGCGTNEEPKGVASGPAIDSKTMDAIKKRGKLVAGVKYDTMLFGLKDPATGKVEGFDIDIAKAIAKSIFGDESKLELKEVTSNTRIPMLQNGEIDIIIATMTINEERKKQVDFSDVYFTAGQSLLVKKGSPIKSLDDIKDGTKVLTQLGSTPAKTIKEKKPKADVREFKNYQEAFTALKAGQGDVLTTDDIILYGMAKQDPNFEVVGGKFTEEPYGMAISKGDAGFVKFVNEVLAKLKSSGEYDKMHEKWIGTKPTK